MPALSRFAFYLLIFMVAFGLFFSPTVRSENDDSSFIRFPSDNDNSGAGDGDLCARTEAPVSCPVNCFRTDPVCGVDGVTYWCGCADARCAGTRVAKLGFCEVGNGGSGSLSGQAFLLVHIVWLILLGFSVLFGLL
ncbi:putative GPI-anchored protein [Actinidia chinensis var. chinensis]|uniref:Putative GPI-anchored protein n=1 Tax=Actinidia chinensis var. chinensis TaxID=1590841 RepID=A0A2R6Q9D6_ACTCC|nr:putative GPI-anchored protein [Actinidia chinensis var. chinensis]